MTVFRWTAALAITTCVVLATGNPVSAQPLFGPGGLTQSTQPTISPYINLLRRGDPLYLNYYGLVRPEQRAFNSIGNLQQQSQVNRQLITDLDTVLEAPTTGHRSYFMSSSRYFLTQNAQPGLTGNPQPGVAGAPGAPRTQPGMGLNPAIAPPKGGR